MRGDGRVSAISTTGPLGRITGGSIRAAGRVGGATGKSGERWTRLRITSEIRALIRASCGIDGFHVGSISMSSGSGWALRRRRSRRPSFSFTGAGASSGSGTMARL